MVPNPESEKNTHTIQLKDTETLRSIGLGIVQNILKSIMIPWLRYRFLNNTFSDTNFMKLILTRLHNLQKKKNCFYFFSFLTFIQIQRLLSHCTKEQNIIQHNKSVLIILIKLKSFSVYTSIESRLLRMLSNRSCGCQTLMGLHCTTSSRTHLVLQSYWLTDVD